MPRPTWDLCVRCGGPHTREPGRFAARLCDDCFAEAWLAWLDGETPTQQAMRELREPTIR